MKVIQTRSEWLEIVARMNMDETIEYTRMVYALIKKTTTDLCSMYEHLALLKQIGEFKWGSTFTAHYLDVVGIKNEKQKAIEDREKAA